MDSSFHYASGSRSSDESIIGMKYPILESETIKNKIVEAYPKGVESLIELDEPSSREVYMIIVLRAPESFINKYISRAQIHESSVDEDRIFTDIDIGVKDNNYETFKEKVTNDQSESKVIHHIYERLIDNEVYQTTLLKTFQKLNQIQELEVQKNSREKQKSVIRSILLEFSESIAKRMKEENEKYYNICNNQYKLIKDSAGEYYELTFEDFIVIFCSIIHYYTGLTINLKMRNKKSKKVFVMLYCDEEKGYDTLADFFGYELQLKPYALTYNQQMNEIKEGKSVSKKVLQPYDLERNNVLHFPPYFAFEMERSDKFRRYTSCDEYHECTEDCATNHKCSKYRNIDKFRLIYKALVQVMQFPPLYQYKFYSMIIYKKNYVDYKEKIRIWNLFSDLAAFSSKRNKRAITTIRNFYGESIAYYFLWAWFFSYWMAFPTVLSFLLKIILSKNSRFFTRQKFTFQIYSFTYYHLCLIFLVLIIEIWATLFFKAWKQQEKMYRYFWGVEKNSITHSPNMFFVPDGVEPLILGEKVSITSKKKQNIKFLTSYSILVIAIIIRAAIVFLLFSYRYIINDFTEFSLQETPNKKKSGKESVTFISVVVMASVNSIITRIIYFFNGFLSKKLSIWENFEITQKQQNSYAIKLIILEFANNFFFLFYIAFYKPYRLVCYEHSCLKELEVACYVLLFWNFLFTLLELVWLFIKRRFRIEFGNFKKKENSKANSLHSIEHQVLCDKKTNLIREYNRKMIRFGYVCLFTVGAPLIPIIVSIGNYIENFIDLFKVFNLYRMEIVDGGNGIGIYNSIFKTLYFIGLMINLNLVLFTSENFIKWDTTKTSAEEFIKNDDGFINNLLLLAIIEHLMLLLIQNLSYNYEPLWFQHLPELKDLYNTKFYLADHKENIK